MEKKRSHISVAKSGRSTKNKKTDLNCGLCKEHGHNIYRCETFKNLPVSDRNLCKNCLLHKKSLECKQSYHITHYAEPTLVSSNLATRRHTNRTLIKRTVLATAWINVIMDSGRRITLQVLIDPVQTSFLSVKAAKGIELRTANIIANVTGIRGNETTTV